MYCHSIVRQKLLSFLVLTSLHCSVFIGVSNVILGQPNTESGQTKRIFHTQMLTGKINMDGVISEADWQRVDWSDHFIQRQPVDGAEPTFDTAIKVLYDNKYIYVAARCFDSDPSKIVKRMSRRDGFDGDWVEINIDSYHDLRSAFSFTLSVSGVKGDEMITLDGNNWDTSWNPIWKGKTNIDSLGWTAEFEIPLSQLRFNKEAEQIWGMQFTRRDFRNESRSNWQPIPQNSGYWVSGFGELHGIENIKPKRQIEIQPYILAQTDQSKKIEGHPFRDGSESKFTAGLDGKIGITNDLTLDFTVNPDFGQVEADPAALNLDGFEIFFNERRPFFVENRNLFNYNISNSNAGGGYDSDNLFYSRRIGSAPHRRLFDSPLENRYIDQPDFSSIIGAVKFSGKTKSGLSIGILESIIEKEEATIRQDHISSTSIVEPFTNFSVVRLQQDFNDGNTIVGLIGTGVNRNIKLEELDFLHDAAYSGGIDFFHQWKDKQWRFNARMVTSRVEGSVESILRTQTNFAHGFNRPGADHLEVDENATSLNGSGGDISLGKYGSRLRFQVGATFRSPELELNDVGFLRNADEVNQYLWVGYKWTKPFSIFRELNVNFNEWSRWDFGGQHLYNAFNINSRATFTNFYSVNFGLNIETNDLSNTWLRSGPTFRKPHGYGGNISVNSDSRKKIRMNASMNGGGGFDGTVNSIGFNGNVTYQVNDAINFTVGPSWNRNHREDQYITSDNIDGTSIYVVSEILQKTLSFTLRANYNITPDLTLQYYGEPFISRGIYTDFKEVLDPLANNPSNRFIRFDDNQIIEQTSLNNYGIDYNRNNSPDFYFQNPNFDFVQFRSNLVARWEYKPGSEVFLVWSQGSTAFLNEINGSVTDALGDNLWDDSLNNTFLLKLTYRFTN